MISLVDISDLPRIPKWMLDSLGKVAEKKVNRDVPICDLDLTHNIQQFIAYLKNDAAESIEGAGGDQTLYNILCVGRDLGLSEDTTANLTLEHYNNEKCQPPWSDADLRLKARNVFRYAKDRPGNATVDALFPDPPTFTSIIKCAFDIRPEDIAYRDHILKNRYIPGYVTVTVAPGGVGKSLLVIAEGLSVASDTQLTHAEVEESGAVWLYNTEDPFDELERRIKAAQKQHKLPDDVLKKFFYTSGYDHPLKLVAYDAKRNTVVNESAVQSIIKEILSRNVKLFLLDPFVECHSVNENDNSAIAIVAQQFRRIAAETGCAVSLVHHTSKGERNSRGNMDKARGASALVSAARIAHTLYPMTEKEAKEYGVSQFRADWYVRIDKAKANLSPPGERLQWYEKKSVKLLHDSQKSTGVLVPVTLDRLDIEDERMSTISDVIFDVLADTPDISLNALSLKIEEMNLDFPGGKSKLTISRTIESLFDLNALKLSKPGLNFTVELFKNERGHKHLRSVKE